MEILGTYLLRIAVAAAVAVVVFWGVLVILRHYWMEGRPARLVSMFRRLGLSADDVAETDLGIHLPTASRLCQSCTNEQACDEWLAQRTQSTGPPRFCPNGRYLRLAKDDKIGR